MALLNALMPFIGNAVGGLREGYAQGLAAPDVGVPVVPATREAMAQTWYDPLAPLAEANRLKDVAAAERRNRSTGAYFDQLAAQNAAATAGLPEPYRAQLAAIPEALRQNEQLYGGLGSWGGANQAYNTNLNALANRQLNLANAANAATFEREKFNEARRQQEFVNQMAQQKLDIESGKATMSLPALVRDIHKANQGMVPIDQEIEQGRKILEANAEIERRIKAGVPGPGETKPTPPRIEVDPKTGRPKVGVETYLADVQKAGLLPRSGTPEAESLKREVEAKYGPGAIEYAARPYGATLLKNLRREQEAVLPLILGTPPQQNPIVRRLQDLTNYNYGASAPAAALLAGGGGG